MIEYLTEDELAATTGYRQRSKQQHALAQMRIPFFVNPRGRILVLREHITGKPEKSRPGPDLSAIRGKKKAA